MAIGPLLKKSIPLIKYPKQIQIFSPGNAGDPSIPRFSGTEGFFMFNNERRPFTHDSETLPVAETGERIFKGDSIVVTDLGGYTYDIRH